jgi:ADP-ribosyl-[dinitrogen reductase] hydrolase
LDRLLADSRLQSRVTHPHLECEVASAFICAGIACLLQGIPADEALASAADLAELPAPLLEVVQKAPSRQREGLENSGWVRHTLESAIWGLLTTSSFEEAVVQVVNLGGDADTAGAVVGALAGAAYGLIAIPFRWREVLRGEWPLRSGRVWYSKHLVTLADDLMRAPELAQADVHPRQR